jgi:ATP-dependent DNA helicase RecQ
VISTGIDDYRRTLKEVFGYPDFRSGQAEVLSRLTDRDVMAVMPTGSGKTLCYVLPAISKGRTLVVSPLIALMRDQVQSLKAVGVRANFINSSLSRSAQNANYLDFIEGRADLLYVAPERLTNARFVEGLRKAGVKLLAIDEAHCVSEWGHDFRPDYLTLGAVREALGRPRTLALTATAEPRVQDDTLARLGIPNAARVVTSVDRPNLRLSVEHLSDLDRRRDRLIELLTERKGLSGIVYARTRRSVEELAEALSGVGIAAEPYHAGLDMSRRDEVQQRFTVDEAPVIVATNAFGMGIDKPDVRFVVHFNMPGRVEAYYQQAGRAGRDGESADCILLYGGHDISAQRQFIERAHPDEADVRETWVSLVAAHAASPSDLSWTERLNRNSDGFAAAIAALRASGLVDTGSLRLLSTDAAAPIDIGSINEHRRHAEDRLSQMVEYAESTSCRRAMILRYFGESPATSCSACDSCLGERREAEVEYPPDLYDALLKLRERIARKTSRAPYQVLESRTVRELATHRPHDRDELLQTWGIGEVKADWFGERLVRAIRVWEDKNPDAPERERRRSQRSFSPALIPEPVVDDDDPLYNELRAWRTERAKRDGVPAYMVFSDRTLKALVSAQPDSRASLMQVKGVGPAKIETFGPDVLRLIKGKARSAVTP